MEKINIAVDGVSSSGKSTMAKDLAKEIGYIYIDSGAMYRAITLYCMQNNIINPDKTINESKLKEHLPNIDIRFKLNPETGRPDTYLNGKNVEKEIRGMEVSQLVSPVSAIGFLRKEMVKQQQKMSLNKGVVMDGRDIGTVVFPDAELKIFVSASPEIRAKRRIDELRMKGDTKTSYEEVLENIKYRDHHDQNRKESPLRKADDAITLDNSNINIEQQLQWAIDMYYNTIRKK
ncbi:MAG: (d)CMP kinase [Dysgonamonadaceae bacterium]|jgi:cytidylate kinase|nr:(d)CMP kinase [Dysgonamonadaceae bacterium]MDD3355446.1 (d)CMP kinase [Dysgonamonadaceae bacterium]MDD3727417.1 (d)CMP kinase [Dysgonamonadaceae bacterium]MDD4245540.1 (d)CMP kinase [Dysgonamonadaceae bacterium]MDD4604809.1 (d)CMP kinase [Dysgonamonadaceae bacterium]